MSYARFGWDDSDVYVYGTEAEGGAVECCCCRLCSSSRPENLMGFESHTEPNAAAMIRHLQEHQRAGHTVPSDTFDELSAIAAAHPEQAPAIPTEDENNG